MNEIEQYTEMEIIDSIKASISISNKHKWEDAQLIGFLTKNIRGLSQSNQKVFYNFFLNEVQSNAHGYRSIAIFSIQELNYTNGYRSIYLFFESLYNEERQKESWTLPNKPVITEQQRILFYTAKVLFQIKYRENTLIYENYILDFLEKVNNSSVITLFIEYININREWAISKMVEYYINVFPHEEELKHYLEKPQSIAYLLSIIKKFDIQALESFAQTVLNLDGSIYKRLKDLILLFAYSKDSLAWGFTETEINAIINVFKYKK